MDQDIVFQTKPQLALDILTDLHTAGALPPWVTGDEVYGRYAPNALGNFCLEVTLGYRRVERGR